MKMEIHKPYNQITMIEYLYMLLEETKEMNRKVDQIIEKVNNYKNADTKQTGKKAKANNPQ